MGRLPSRGPINHIHKGAWTTEEDRLLVGYIQVHGEGNWKSLPDAAGLQRCGKSCRLRWKNYLRPDLKRGGFTTEEENVIIKLQGLLGNRWSRISENLPGRTDNEIKNYWNTHIKRQLLKQRYVKETTMSCRRCKSIDLALDLSISPPSSSSSSSQSVLSSSSSLTKRAAKESRQWGVTGQELGVPPLICFCYHLGFKGGDTCNCQSVDDRSCPHGFDYYYGHF